jgi:hypothetical protein
VFALLLTAQLLALLQQLLLQAQESTLKLRLQQVLHTFLSQETQRLNQLDQVMKL